MAQSCFIDQLPAEIMREIFLFSYCNQLERPAKFLRVSHRWHTVARETRTLWSILNLYICPKRENCKRIIRAFRLEHEWETSVAIRSFSLEGLLKSIDRLGSSEFTLLADKCFHCVGRVTFKEDILFSSIKSLISNRCTELFVTTRFIRWDEDGLLLERRALKALNLKGPCLWWLRIFRHRFFTGVAATPHLRSISLRSSVTPQITECPGLLTSVHHLALEISSAWTSAQLEEFGALLREVRTLSLQGRVMPSTVHNVSFASQHLVHLEVPFIPPSIFSSSVHLSLVVLFLEEKHSTDPSTNCPGSNTTL